MLTGLLATTASALASNSPMPALLIEKPCQRTTGTMHARVESLSPGVGYLKCLSRARV